MFEKPGQKCAIPVNRSSRWSDRAPRTFPILGRTRPKLLSDGYVPGAWGFDQMSLNAGVGSRRIRHCPVETLMSIHTYSRGRATRQFVQICGP